MKLRDFLDVIDWDSVPSSVVFLIPIVGKHFDYDSEMGYNESRGGHWVNWKRDLVIMDDNDASPYELGLYTRHNISVKMNEDYPNEVDLKSDSMEPYVIDEYGQIYVVIY